MLINIHIAASLMLISRCHRDHAGGNEQLVTMVPSLTVCGNDDRIGAMNKRVKTNDKLKVPLVCTKLTT